MTTDEGVLEEAKLLLYMGTGAVVACVLLTLFTMWLLS